MNVGSIICKRFVQRVILEPSGHSEDSAFRILLSFLKIMHCQARSALIGSYCYTTVLHFEQSQLSCNTGGCFLMLPR